MIEINIAKQQLDIFEEDKLIKSFRISTAKAGTGQQYGSFQTPLGKHRIAEKIGAGTPINTIFIAREPTGELYSPQLEANHPERKDWILTRILWLEGLEAGFNQGGEVDTKNRKIYIHGCPDARPMGQPFSHGCITLHNSDMLTLFDLVDAGVPVFIRA